MNLELIKYCCSVLHISNYVRCLPTILGGISSLQYKHLISNQTGMVPHKQVVFISYLSRNQTFYVPCHQTLGQKHCSAITPTNATCVQSGHANNGNYCEYNRFGPFSNKHYECVQDGPNPFYTTVSFDNIGSAWIVIFQVICVLERFNRRTSQIEPPFSVSEM